MRRRRRERATLEDGGGGGGCVRRSITPRHVLHEGGPDHAVGADQLLERAVHGAGLREVRLHEVIEERVVPRQPAEPLEGGLHQVLLRLARVELPDSDVVTMMTMVTSPMTAVISTD